jgi:hypothetical protein
MVTEGECPHQGVDKYVTTHGMACRECLTKEDFDAYPGWTDELGKKHAGMREQLETSRARTDQLARNLGRASAG